MLCKCHTNLFLLVVRLFLCFPLPLMCLLLQVALILLHYELLLLLLLLLQLCCRHCPLLLQLRLHLRLPCLWEHLLLRHHLYVFNHLYDLLLYGRSDRLHSDTRKFVFYLDRHGHPFALQLRAQRFDQLLFLQQHACELLNASVLLLQHLVLVYRGRRRLGQQTAGGWRRPAAGLLFNADRGRERRRRLQGELGKRRGHLKGTRMGQYYKLFRIFQTL